MSIHFKNERERNFYDNGKDMDFVRYHKRVSKNFLNGIQELLDTSKQTIARGIAQQYKITLNYIRLNKACTVCHVWWNLILIHPEMVSDEYRQV